MKDPAEEWGLPDWTNGGLYALMHDWDDNRLRWEFVRRRDDYRRDFQKALSEQSDPLCLPPDISPEEAAMFESKGMRAWPFWHPGAKKYLLDEFFDPVISDWITLGPEWNSGLVIGGFDQTEWVVNSEGDLEEETGAEHMVALTFDLRRPLKAQFKEAKELLGQWQLEYFAYGAGADENLDFEEAERIAFTMPKITRAHIKKWPLYLRVLDARRAGASLSQIGNFIPKEIANSDGKEKAAHNILRQAEELQFRF